ncbi:heterokaryon incompatibility protein [Leptodontidium sp. MPI-SDFR-AT-0119]|nr:heterokaryon incompatibility protein [Leptodontidium sp. MPI-SDFR-AT-0119]
MRPRRVNLGLEETVSPWVPWGTEDQKSPQIELEISWDSGLAAGSNRQEIYGALDPSIGEFRILFLLPSTEEASIIECQLRQASFDSRESFEALSYVWGDPEFTSVIKLNGILFSITPRLEEALRHLRYQDKPRMLWVDALCIDQANNNERRYQVGLMRQIYSNCTSGILWLGADEKGVLSRAMTLLTKIEGHDIESLGYSKEPVSDRISDEGGGPEYKLSRMDWNAIQELLVRNTVWRRVWIMQEISLAPRVVLTSEKLTLEWSLIESLLGMGKHYTDAFHATFGHGSVSRLASETFSTAQIIKSQRKLCRQEGDTTGTSLLDVLARFRFTESTDPRDKVFALLGLASDTLGVRADYSMDVDAVFTDAAVRIINQRENLDIICQSQWQSFSNPKRRQGLPSWVPDFSWPGNGTFLFAQRAIFGAGRPKCKIPAQLTSGKMALNGYLISPLSLYLNNFPAPIKNQYGYLGVEEMWAALLGWWTKEYVSDEQTKLGEDSFQAFWRTIAADRKRPSLQKMQRLSDEDIAEDNTLIRAIRDGIEEPEKLGDMNCFSMIREMLESWQFCLTDSKHFSMIPAGSVSGDIIVVLDGAKVPLVLRPVPSDDSPNTTGFSVVGGAYVHGLMDGEVITGGFEERAFTIS